MKRTLVVRRAARCDVGDAAEWYEKQKPGLGSVFAEAVESLLHEIAETPLRFPVADGDVRVALVQPYRYAVYFRVRLETVVVIAVVHTSRDSSILRSRF